MKFVLGLFLVSNAFAFEITEKNPKLVDISVDTLIDHACAASGQFNPAACVDVALKCYRKASWPKTVDVNYKIQVASHCLKIATDI